MKTFFDILSNSLQIRTKPSKETDSRYNPIRTRKLNPTRSRLPQSLQKRELQILREKQQFSEDEELPFQQGLLLKEDIVNPKIRNHNREIFMAFLSDATNRKANSTTLEDLDYDEFLSEPEMSEAAATSYEIHPPPPGITVTVHLDNNPKMILKTEHHQQLGDSFDYSNSDYSNIGRNTKTVIINKREDHEEVKAYSPTSNYRIPDIYGYNPRKRRRDKPAPPSQP